LFDLKNDPGEFHNAAKEYPETASQLRQLLLKRFRDTHPDAPGEPKLAKEEDILDWYLRPRDV
ncbi:MAG: hypothetical protein M3Z23_18840, partial [Acidobacteriota bacterium]|nr:hypothetical protein [Acidobacteriota bacterium]